MKMQLGLLHLYLHVNTLFNGQHENGIAIIQFAFKFDIPGGIVGLPSIYEELGETGFSG